TREHSVGSVWSGNGRLLAAREVAYARLGVRADAGGLVCSVAQMCSIPTQTNEWQVQALRLRPPRHAGALSGMRHRGHAASAGWLRGAAKVPARKRYVPRATRTLQKQVTVPRSVSSPAVSSELTAS